MIENADLKNSFAVEKMRISAFKRHKARKNLSFLSKLMAVFVLFGIFCKIMRILKKAFRPAKIMKILKFYKTYMNFLYLFVPFRNCESLPKKNYASRFLLAANLAPAKIKKFNISGVYICIYIYVRERGTPNGV